MCKCTSVVFFSLPVVFFRVFYPGNSDVQQDFGMVVLLLFVSNILFYKVFTLY